MIDDMGSWTVRQLKESQHFRAWSSDYYVHAVVVFRRLSKETIQFRAVGNAWYHWVLSTVLAPQLGLDKSLHNPRRSGDIMEHLMGRAIETQLFGFLHMVFIHQSLQPVLTFLNTLQILR